VNVTDEPTKLVEPTGWVTNVGATLTINRAPSLRIVAKSSVISATYSPSFTNCALLMASVGDVAPAMSWPSSCHWYRTRPVPVAATVNVTFDPGLTTRPKGCSVMRGGMLTVTRADRLTTKPAPFQTVTA